MPRGVIETPLTPPAGGASAFAPHLLDAGQANIRFTKNVILRDRWLVPRPGLGQSTTVSLATPANGFLFYIANERNLKVVAINPTAGGVDGKVLYQNGVTWTDITGAVPLASGLDLGQVTRMVEFPSGGFFYVLGVSGYQSTVWSWNGVASAIVPVTAAPPARDICVAANRVILFNVYEDDFDGKGKLPRPHRIRWSEFNDPFTYGGINTAELTDTQDIIIAGKALGRVNYVIYKKDTEWLGTLQAGIYPFKFEQQDEKPGPLCPQVVVNFEGMHYYVAQDFSIYSFDGARGKEIGTTVQRFLLETINSGYTTRCFGLVSRHDRTIYFFYPGAGGTPFCNRAISYKIDTEQWFAHEFSFSFSAGGRGVDFAIGASWDYLGGLGYTWDTISTLFASWDAVFSGIVQAESLLRAASPSSAFLYNYNPGFYADAGTAFTCKWRSAHLAPNSPSKRARVQSFESYFARPTAAQNATIAIGTTDSISDDPVFPGGVLTTTHDVFTEPVKLATYDEASAGVGTGTAEARFVVVDHETIQPTAGTGAWKWGGGVLRSYEQETA